MGKTKPTVKKRSTRPARFELNDHSPMVDSLSAKPKRTLWYMGMDQALPEVWTLSVQGVVESVKKKLNKRK